MCAVCGMRVNPRCLQPALFEGSLAKRELREADWRDDGQVTWNFRNRIDLRPTSKLQCSEPEWIIDDSQPGKQIRLVAKFPRTVLPVPGGIDLAGPEHIGPIAEATRLVLTGSGY